MLRSVFLFSVSFAALGLAWSGAAQAQNYVRTENLNGPNVVIDFGALDQANNAPNQWAVAPAIAQQNLAPPAPAPKLQAPTPTQAMAMRPMTSTAEMGDAPSRTMPTMDHLKAAAITPAPAVQQRAVALPAAIPAPALAPAMANPNRPDRAGTHSRADLMSDDADLPPPTNFSARDMLNSAPPAPSAMRPAPAPITSARKTPAQPSVVQKPVVATPDVSTPENMLATARGTKNGNGRVNLASISDGPPLPTHAASTTPVVSKPAPAAAPMKPVTTAMAKPVMPPTSVKSLPPASSLDDLLSDDTPRATPKPASAAPKQEAKLPASVTASELKQAPPIEDDLPPPSAVKADAATKVASIAPMPGAEVKSASPLATTISVNFAKDDGTLDDAAKKDLDGLIASLKKDSKARAQIRAYASGTPETSGQARRLSLTRALATRSYVVDQNIPATRLDIRALGNGQGALESTSGENMASAGNMDRVDMMLVK